MSLTVFLADDHAVVRDGVAVESHAYHVRLNRRGLVTNRRRPKKDFRCTQNDAKVS